MGITSIASSKPRRDPFTWIYWIFFLIFISFGIILMVIKPFLPKQQVGLPSLNHNMSVYQVIVSKDIYIRWVDKNTVPTGIVLDARSLIGHYTLIPVLANKPILENQIGPKPAPSLISNTLTVTIPVNSAILLGGCLGDGDIVSVVAIPLSNTTLPPTIVFNKVLVLDIKLVVSQTVIIIAVPANHLIDYLTKTHNATILIERWIE
jgi:hypothetical protein